MVWRADEAGAILLGSIPPINGLPVTFHFSSLFTLVCDLHRGKKYYRGERKSLQLELYSYREMVHRLMVHIKFYKCIS